MRNGGNRNVLTNLFFMFHSYSNISQMFIMDLAQYVATHPNTLNFFFPSHILRKLLCQLYITYIIFFSLSMILPDFQNSILWEASEKASREEICEKENEEVCLIFGPDVICKVLTWFNLAPVEFNPIKRWPVGWRGRPGPQQDITWRRPFLRAFKWRIITVSWG